jgi:very-short-patch-repair endonuclease
MRLHPRAFKVGVENPSDEGRALAAVLACGPEAVASHGTALFLWGVANRAPGIAHVTTPSGAGPSGIEIHRSDTLTKEDVQWRHGIPVTTVARTLVDLAPVLDPHTLEAAYALANRRGLTTAPSLKAAVDRAGRRHGTPRLATIAAEARLTRSDLERRMHALVAAAELPRGDANVQLHGYEVDLYWPDHDLVVEVDAFGTHGDPAAFERDRRRDADLQSKGITVIRFTGARIERRPYAVVAELAAVLRAQGAA